MTSDTPRTDAAEALREAVKDSFASGRPIAHLDSAAEAVLRDLASARAERDEARARFTEIEGYNVGLAEEVRIVRSKLDELVAAVENFQHEDDEGNDGQKYLDAINRVHSAIEGARPHTEAAITLQATLDLATEQDATIADLRQKLAEFHDLLASEKSIADMALQLLKDRCNAQEERAETAEAKLREWAREAGSDIDHVATTSRPLTTAVGLVAKWQRRAEGGER